MFKASIQRGLQQASQHYGLQLPEAQLQRQQSQTPLSSGRWYNEAKNCSLAGLGWMLAETSALGGGAGQISLGGGGIAMQSH